MKISVSVPRVSASTKNKSIGIGRVLEKSGIGASLVFSSEKNLLTLLGPLKWDGPLIFVPV